MMTGRLLDDSENSKGQIQFVGESNPRKPFQRKDLRQKDAGSWHGRCIVSLFGK
jgi:hypothetical protein